MSTDKDLSEFLSLRIFLIRGYRIILDSDLASLYRVETKQLNKAVQRNMSRFPPDFMFELTPTEFEDLRFQSGTSNSPSHQRPIQRKHGGRRYLPKAFTEQGVAMLSSVLRSEGAAQANVAIMRAFVKLREMMSSHKELAQKIHELEKKYDGQFQTVFEAIRKLMTPAEPPKKRRMGVHWD